MHSPASQSRCSTRSGAGTHPSRKRANTLLIENAHGPNAPLSTKRRRPTPTPEAEIVEEEEEEVINEGIDNNAEQLHWRGS